MDDIIDKFLEERNIHRLVYRLIKAYGPINKSLLCTLLGYVAQNVHSGEKACKNIESALVFLSLEYDFNLSYSLEKLLAAGYISVTKLKDVKYISIK